MSTLIIGENSSSGNNEIITSTGRALDVNVKTTSPTSSQTVIAYSGAFTDRSGTITSGGTAQTLMAANANRKYFLIQNLSTENLWINFTTTAVAGQPSLRITPGTSFVLEGFFTSTEAVSIIGATTGSAFSAKEG